MGGLPYIALCASVLALGLIAGFLLAAPLSSQASPACMLSGCVHPLTEVLGVEQCPTVTKPCLGLSRGLTSSPRIMP